MTRLILFLTVLIIGVSASALPRPAEAIPDWPPLLNCSDVNADGHVNILDIGWIVVKFGTVYPSDDYQLLYDVSGGGAVNVIDIATVVLDFGQSCPLIDTQVAAATLATMKYADCQDAVADGYGAVSGQGVYVPKMGIHISKGSNLSSDFDLEQPFGLVCSETFQGSGTVDRLLGLWYIDPVAETCAIYGISGQCQDSSIQPIGFDEANDDEDNLDPDGDGPQGGWHTHINLCVGTSLLLELGEIPDVHQVCKDAGGFLVVPIYGWMLHLYTMVPNPAGRFMKWNANVP